MRNTHQNPCALAQCVHALNRNRIHHSGERNTLYKGAPVLFHHLNAYMLKRWKTLSTSIVFENPWWTYKRDTFQIPDGVSGEYHYVYTRGSSMVVPITPEGELLLVNQFRYLCDRESIEFPCGSVNEGDSYLDTARHELEEETGFRADHFEEVSTFNPYNGVTSEICHVFLATELTPGNANPDATEEFELIRCSPSDFEEKIATNEVWDGMTLAAWMLVRHCVYPRSL